MDRRYKTKRTSKKGFTKQNNSKRYRTLCHYIEETQSMYKQMYKTAYLKLLIIDKVDIFLKKTAKKYCKMLKGVIY